MDSTSNRTTHEEDSPEEADLIFNQHSFCCCCIAFPWSRRRNSNWWGRIQESDHRGFFAGASMKLRDWSELLAGPRWKNFIRRYNRNSRHLGAKLQYDPLSYALNFDENPDADLGFRDFSSRFAAPCSSGKSVKDFADDAAGLR